MVMASIGEMIASAATSVEGGASALTELFAAGDSAAEAGKVVAGAATAASPEVNAALSEVGMVDMPSGSGGMVSAASNVASDSPFLPTWATKAIGPVLMSLTQAALRPQHNPIAPAGGHGVSASAAGAMKPFQEVEKMAGDNPLDGLNQWSHLF
ncbi:hypothetical protein [Lelliottia wanjuensis]|uniref:hypothetical protein n=1 Tax=Lelliottia wanjuensis TaxID=3050585 RepID=UPI002549FDD5|nr:hypothetical protein [Lelliottia sp. V86_10]MDK9586734.1 hypothetical protein [Lelliottia sp. V86_10]